MENVQYPKIKRKELHKALGSAFINRDIKKIQYLLSDDGTYEIQSQRLNTLIVNKKRFIAWIKKRMKQEEKKLTITMDICMLCSIGANVLMINDGSFPRRLKDSSERSKTGLMVESSKGLITQIKFCYSFLKTENKNVFEIKMERIQYYTRCGYSYNSAKKMAEDEINKLKE